MTKNQYRLYKANNPFEGIFEKLSPVILYLGMLENGEFGSLSTSQLRTIKQTKHYAQKTLQHIESYNQ